MQRAIGIDLGTAYTCAAVFRNGHHEIIPDHGSPKMPSCVAFTDTSRLVGFAANNQAAGNPQNTVFNALRFIGRDFVDSAIQIYARCSSVRVIDIYGKPAFQVQYRGETKCLKPEEILAMILGRIKENAEAYLGNEVTRAVLTIPAFFNQSQRQSIRDAAHIAGIEVVGFCCGPAAASLDYASRKLRTGERTVLFADLGAGTFDVMMATIEEGLIEVKSTATDFFLGGEVFDSRIVNKMTTYVKRGTGNDITVSPRSVLRMKKASEKAKCELSSQLETPMHIDSLYAGVDFYYPLKRAELVDLCQDLFRSMISLIEQVLRDGDSKNVEKEKENLTEIVLLGGSSRIVPVQDVLADYFKGKLISKSLNPDESAARGAALHAARFTPQEDPAAVGSSSILGEILLLDISPFQYGFDNGDGFMKVVVKRNTILPTKRSDIFSTWQDNAPTFQATALEGFRMRAKHNLRMGQIYIPVPPAPRGVPEVEVTFDIDVQGRSSITLLEKKTRVSKRVSLEAYDRLAHDEIEQMMAEAAEYNANEKIEKARVAARINLEEEALEMKTHLMESHQPGAMLLRATLIIDGILDWLVENEYADISEYHSKHADLKAILVDFDLKSTEEQNTQQPADAIHEEDFLHFMPRAAPSDSPTPEGYLKAWSQRAVPTTLLSADTDGNQRPRPSRNHTLLSLENTFDFLGGEIDFNDLQDLRLYIQQHPYNREDVIWGIREQNTQLAWLIAVHEKDFLRFLAEDVPIPEDALTPKINLNVWAQVKVPAHLLDDVAYTNQLLKPSDPPSTRGPGRDPKSPGLSSNVATPPTQSTTLGTHAPSSYPRPRSAYVEEYISEGEANPEQQLSASPQQHSVSTQHPSASTSQPRAFEQHSHVASPRNAPTPAVPKTPMSLEVTPESIASPVLDSTSLATPRSSEVGLGDIFASSSETRQTQYSDAEFNQISTYLRNTGRPSWSSVPRLYTVLRLVGQLPFLDQFIEQGITDIWFPFTTVSLPVVLTPTSRANFLQIQSAVLSKSLRFEKNLERTHALFGKGEPLPFEVVGRLGAGAHGSVDKVVSTVSHREYARKLFRRTRAGRDDIKSFLLELQVLKRVSHRHCVELVQSYTDPKFFALIMLPVADYNLFDYYDIAANDIDKLSLLRSFFGCLASGLQYVHDIKIRHRDIKPQNVLVKGDRVFLTDFGIALDWEQLSRSTTTADSGKTWPYAAPEVARYEKRNTASDIWSLGCVFLEIITVLKGETVSGMRHFFKERSDNYRFYANVTNLPAWMEKLKNAGGPKDDRPLMWVEQMLQETAEGRPTAAMLYNDIIAESAMCHVPFCGPCCNEEENSPGFEEEDDDEMWGHEGEPSLEHLHLA